MTTLVQAVINAAYLGSLYALYALGVVIIFGIMQLINFAHASLIMAGAYTMVLTGSWPLIPRLLLTVAVCVVLALVLELVAFRGLRGSSPATLLVSSFAVTILLGSLAEAIFGSLPKSTQVVPAFLESWSFGAVYLPKLNVITIVVAGLLMGALALFMSKTRIGLHMRAAAADFTTSRVLGVRANRVISMAFAISGVFAAAAAVLLLGASGSVTPTFGLDALLFGLIAAVLGGLSTLRGAALGGFVLGAASQVLQTVLPLDVRPYRDALLFAAVFVILVVRPQGLVSKSEGVRV